MGWWQSCLAAARSSSSLNASRGCSGEGGQCAAGAASLASAHGGSCARAPLRARDASPAQSIRASLLLAAPLGVHSLHAMGEVEGGSAVQSADRPTDIDCDLCDIRQKQARWGPGRGRRRAGRGGGRGACTARRGTAPLLPRPPRTHRPSPYTNTLTHTHNAPHAPHPPRPPWPPCTHPPPRAGGAALPGTWGLCAAAVCGVRCGLWGGRGVVGWVVHRGVLGDGGGEDCGLGWGEMTRERPPVPRCPTAHPPGPPARRPPPSLTSFIARAVELFCPGLSSEGIGSVFLAAARVVG